MEVIGYTKESLYEFATKRGMHPGSANALMEFAVEIQQKALTHHALERMSLNAAELGLGYEGPAVEIRVLGEEK
jgi:hypothetical protein